MPAFDSPSPGPTRRQHLLRPIVHVLVFSGIALLGATTLLWLVPNEMAAPLAPIYALIMVVFAHHWFSPKRRTASGSAAAPRDDERGR